MIVFGRRGRCVVGGAQRRNVFGRRVEWRGLRPRLLLLQRLLVGLLLWHVIRGRPPVSVMLVRVLEPRLVLVGQSRHD